MALPLVISFQPLSVHVCVRVFKVELTRARRCRVLVKYLLFKADSHNFLKLMSGAGCLDSGSGIELFVELFHLALVTCKSLRISLLSFSLPLPLRN